ncbi:MAG: hypothetical protein A2W99_05370 [Bacteroidetes bacterium GWF2_33_16]|nr:MAG: hypothetical protein A2X00_17890 [Bacteroidetes bacterium GWE2_32_14]OFY06091.1 MAG: hypothetical protein A2W99_05370 [Bacteroidetes bacterium GWF2_33_16]
MKTMIFKKELTRAIFIFLIPLSAVLFYSCGNMQEKPSEAVEESGSGDNYIQDTIIEEEQMEEQME